MSLVSKEISPFGESIYSWKGRRQASFYNPHAEAADWWIKSRRAGLDPKSYFVLGVGSGFHIRRLLCECTANIVIIDSRAELMAAVKGDFNWNPERVSFSGCSNLSQLKKDSAVASSIKQGSFLVLDHTVSQVLDGAFFNEARSWLVARNWKALAWQRKLRGLPSGVGDRAFESAGPLLTIKDLDFAMPDATLSALTEMIT